VNSVTPGLFFVVLPRVTSDWPSTAQRFVHDPGNEGKREPTCDIDAALSPEILFALPKKWLQCLN
jgi:hypothetical protein